MNDVMTPYAEFFADIVRWLGPFGYFTVAGVLFVIATVLILGVNRYMGEPIYPDLLIIFVIVAGCLSLIWVGVLAFIPLLLAVAAVAAVAAYLLEKGVVRLYRFVDGLKGSKM